MQIGAVVVIAPTAAAADGWATAMFALGEEEGLALARQQQLAVLFLILDGSSIREHASPAFATYRTLAAS